MPARGDAVIHDMSGTPPGFPGQRGPELACVILAHQDPVHLHRLIQALDPFPVYLHVDVRVDEQTHRSMTEGLPARVTLLDRQRTGWARWENVAAELDGYRAALRDPRIEHVALLTGTDYPLASAERIAEVLAGLRGRSVTTVQRLPRPGWGRSGGLARLRYPHWVVEKRCLRLPIPRRLPADVVLAGGSQLKVLARQHAQDVLDVVDRRPDLVRFWRRSWIPDETFVPSVVSTPDFCPSWADRHVDAEMWWIGWDGAARKSPPWLTMEHWGRLRQRASAESQNPQRLFARKFSSVVDVEILDAIDRQLRHPVRIGP